MGEKKKLNIFQRGILQKAVTALAYFGSIAIGAYILDWADKRIFFTTITEATQRDIISAEAATGLKRFIEGRDGTIIFAIILIGLFCVVLGWLFMRWASKRNWSWPVTLPKAVEFRTAMRKLGVTTPEDEISFVKKYKLSVFIALCPINGDEQENIRAQFYAFAHHSTFSESEVFERYIGKKTLCLDANDYDRLIMEGRARSSLEESVAIAEKDEEIKGLRLALAAAVKENQAIVAERDDLRGKVGIQDAQEGGRVVRLRKERLQWAALTPVAERLIREAPAGKIYTLPEIKKAFAAEWELRDDLREQMLKLTGDTATTPSGSMYDAIKEELKEAGLYREKGGRPLKNSKGQG
ncbi:MAG: hypothetical protein LUG19_03200 [Desulfovibrio sp.]|uniref:hypothetical protein n=1 Tax=Desulfovibrio sp. TaxID=885 RepID=UPI00258F1584|nr:hypothetical protein [Desulfovibrio sp.]MCD7983247.1 hypothetical protein [Desulfovibrio sp.]